MQRWLGPAETADRLNLDVRHLARLVDKGILTCKPGKRGRVYPWPDSLHAWMQHQIAESIGAPGGTENHETIDLNTERALLTRRQREEIELRMAERSKALIPYQVMIREQESLIARVAAVVNRWEDDWAGGLTQLDEAAARRVAGEQRARLQQACFELVADADELMQAPDDVPRDDEAQEAA